MEIKLDHYNDYSSFVIKVIKGCDCYIAEIYSYTYDFGSDYVLEKSVQSLTKEGALLKAEMWVDNLN